MVWVSDDGSGFSTLYDVAGTPQTLIVTVPDKGTAADNPTGTVFYGGPAFVVTHGAMSPRFAIAAAFSLLLIAALGYWQLTMATQGPQEYPAA